MVRTKELFLTDSVTICPKISLFQYVVCTLWQKISSNASQPNKIISGEELARQPFEALKWTKDANYAAILQLVDGPIVYEQGIRLSKSVLWFHGIESIYLVDISFSIRKYGCFLALRISQVDFIIVVSFCVRRTLSSQV